MLCPSDDLANGIPGDPVVPADDRVQFDLRSPDDLWISGLGHARLAGMFALLQLFEWPDLPVEPSVAGGHAQIPPASF
ncbi:MAG: hypothetical protein WC261_08070 [Synergistaceae bacterium]